MNFRVLQIFTFSSFNPQYYFIGFLTNDLVYKNLMYIHIFVEKLKMRIEEEIRQEKFKSEYQKLVINQLFTGKWVGERISRHLKPFGLTSPQYNVLRILRGQNGKAMSVNSITERMIDKMSNVSRLLDKLVSKSYIERTTCPKDRRQLDVIISNKGIRIIDQIEQLDDDLFEDFQNLSLEEAKKLNNLLDKLRG